MPFESFEKLNHFLLHSFALSTLPFIHSDQYAGCAFAGSKETAFVYAVTSAGVVHAVTQACSSGNLTVCTCDLTSEGRSTPQGWKWGGCR